MKTVIPLIDIKSQLIQQLRNHFLLSEEEIELINVKIGG